MEYLIALALWLLTTLAGPEVTGLIERLSSWLVHRAARRLPAEERAEFIAQVLADLQEIEGPVFKLYNALGTFKAARGVAVARNLKMTPGSREPQLRTTLRTILATSDYALTLMVAAGLFTACSVEFPAATKDALRLIGSAHDKLETFGLPDAALLWLDILLQPGLVVFILFAIAVRLLFEIMYALFNGRQFPAETPTAHS